MARRWWYPVASLAVLGIGLASPSRLPAGPFDHVTDGMFGTNEWNDPNDPNVLKTFFPLVGNSGGAFLYVEQGFSQVAGTVVRKSSPTQLFLGYDITQNPAGAAPPLATSFFDVFFQVAGEGNDYDARVHANSTVDLFEKPTGTVSRVNPDGSLDVADPPWTQLSPNDPDFIRANPIGAIGFTGSPDNPVPHVFVEFQLNINNNLGGRSGGQDGLYDPSPAFWSGSGKPGGTDPPFTSGIFSLNPDGSSVVTPTFGPNGGPALQPQDVVPEPSSLVLLSLGLGTVALGSCLRRRRARTR